MFRTIFVSLGFLVLATATIFAAAGANPAADPGVGGQQPAQKFETHQLKFGADGKQVVSVLLPSGGTETPLDPHGSKSRWGIGYSHPNAVGVTVELTATAVSDKDGVDKEGVPLEAELRRYEDLRHQQAPASIYKFESSLSKATKTTPGEVSVSLVMAPLAIRWTETRAIELLGPDGQRYLIACSVNGWKAGVNKDVPSPQAVAEQQAEWQRFYTDAIVKEILKSIAVVGNGAPQAAAR